MAPRKKKPIIADLWQFLADHPDGVVNTVGRVLKAEITELHEKIAKLEAAKHPPEIQEVTTLIYVGAPALGLAGPFGTPVGRLTLEYHPLIIEPNMVGKALTRASESIAMDVMRSVNGAVKN